MVFPLFDDNSDRRRFPYVNYVFIAINVFVFVVLQGAGAENNKFTYAFATVPEEIVTGEDSTETIFMKDPRTGQMVPAIQLEHTPISVYITLLTSMFMHGSWMHLLGNMLFLWIFGDNVEDFLGHFRYVAFYLTCGLAADLAHIVATYTFHQDPRIPCLGASGAISGVLGGYLLLFPHRRVTVILFRFLTEVPAFVAIGIWFLFQLLEGLGSFGGGSGGGVAYGAHIGGFVAGVALVKIFALGQDEPHWRTRLQQEPPRSFRRTPW